MTPRKNAPRSRRPSTPTNPKEEPQAPELVAPSARSVRHASTADAAARQPLELTYHAPAEPWSTNKRVHWSTRHRLTKAWREGAGYAARNAHRRRHLPRLPLDGRWQVTMTVPFARGGRRDPMNYVGTVLKATVDGLVDAGLWPDDTPQWVQITEPRLVVDKGATVHVRLTPIDPDEATA